MPMELKQHNKSADGKVGGEGVRKTCFVGKWGGLVFAEDEEA